VIGVRKKTPGVDERVSVLWQRTQLDPAPNGGYALPQIEVAP
jgi:hypothetical protein